MKEIKTYKAYDGSTYPSQERCLRYERSMIAIWKGKVTSELARLGRELAILEELEMELEKEQEDT